MGERAGRTTRRFDSTELIERTKQPILDDAVPLDDDDPLKDWDDSVQTPVALGSQPAALPTTSRTQTLSDPLTTGLLAEVARRTETVENDPSIVSAALRTTQEIDTEVLAEVLRAEQQPAHKLK